jgi:hypothetical protein
MVVDIAALHRAVAPCRLLKLFARYLSFFEFAEVDFTHAGRPFFLRSHLRSMAAALNTSILTDIIFPFGPGP